MHEVLFSKILILKELSHDFSKFSFLLALPRNVKENSQVDNKWGNIYGEDVLDSNYI